MKALIPAAGAGKRWFPWTMVVPKELLPINGFPVIHIVLEEIVSAGIKDIGIILNESKILIKKYIENVWIKRNRDIRIIWFYQKHSCGVLDALLQASDWVKGNPTAVIYPDEIHPLDGGIGVLRKEFEANLGNWIGVTSNKQRRRQLLFELEEISDKIFYITNINKIRKNKKAGHGTGRYILRYGFEHFEDVLSHYNEEQLIELDDALLFLQLSDNGFSALIMNGPICDVGDPHNYITTISIINGQKNRYLFVNSYFKN